jgi:serine/threonine protein kinase
LNDRDDPAPTVDSQTAQTKLNTAVPALGDPEATLDSDPREATAKRDLLSIGPYRLMKKLGEGGMGQVWLAEQTAPLRRQVALKLIKVGMYDDLVLQRFQSERQSLAIMEHPWIAKVFDAGATSDGQPYFVMEYVPGVPITDYCDRKQMRIRERLELFIKVCEGVQHAHQKAIMHRDLKPANILVVEMEGKPVPRIIDFGLAKATTPQWDGQTAFTQVGGWVGTPGYMSPEQADPTLSDADTRTDVYSLGALLYVLLTGFLPLERKDWRKEPFHEFLRRLREEDPPRPSTKAATATQDSRSVAEVRGTEPKQLVSLLHGDLDGITMKALERDRARRYGTPSELAADVSRYLNHEPVVARPTSTGYRLRKYVRRHRFGVAVATGLVLVLVAFAVTQALQLRRISRERDRANRITEFMTGMFKVSDPSEARGNTITAREILDKASKDIDTGLRRDPELQAQMMSVMGKVYLSLGLYLDAQPLLGRSLEIRRRVLGAKHPETLTSMEDVATLSFEEGLYAEAEKSDREVLELRRQILGARHPDTLSSMSGLASSLSRQGEYSEAEKLDRETLDVRRQVLGTEHADTVDSMLNLAGDLFDEHRYSEAEKLDREALEIDRHALGADHPRTLALMDDLALVLDAEAQYSEAERLLRDALETGRRVLGPDHPGNTHSMVDLASILAHEHRYGEAENLLRETREIQRRVLGPDHPVTAISTYELACFAALQGRQDQAVSLLRDAIDHGLDPSAIEGIEEDPDLKSLHGDPRFGVLVTRAKEREASVQKR